MNPNGLLKDAIKSRSIRTSTMPFSHDRSSNGNNNQNTTADDSAAVTKNDADEKMPSPPTNCCMSGCANCVWIKYAEDLSSQLRDGSDVAREIIMKEVQDTNMRSFLEMELRMLKMKEKK